MKDPGRSGDQDPSRSCRSALTGAPKPDTSPRTEVGRVGTAFNRMLGHVESALAQRAASESRL
ncbi:MAG TPA: hypothetical protein VGL63_15715 [Streptosporangiaceae bacterium]